jgi:hypothetical protein
MSLQHLTAEWALSPRTIVNKPAARITSGDSHVTKSLVGIVSHGRFNTPISALLHVVLSNT